MLPTLAQLQRSQEQKTGRQREQGPHRTTLITSSGRAHDYPSKPCHLKAHDNITLGTKLPTHEP